MQRVFAVIGNRKSEGRFVGISAAIATVALGVFHRSLVLFGTPTTIDERFATHSDHSELSNPTDFSVPPTMTERQLTAAFDQSLPVGDVRKEVEDALDTDRPLVVVAPTGSGKSTRLPMWLADERPGTIIVVEPRRVACRSLATYLAETIGESVGDTIGYRVRFDDATSRKTRVIFVTTGIALRMIAGDTSLDFAAMMIDEFHERGWEVDLLAAVMVDAIDRDDYTGSLLLTSATVDAREIAHQISAEIVEAEGRTHPVDITYRGDVAAPTSDDLAGRVTAAVDTAAGDDEDGDILVFLPGKGEIADCKSALQPVASRRNLDVLGVHGRLPTRYLSKAFSSHDGNRRVFLSTNVAETSLTLPGVTTVIDSGLVRMRIHRGGRSALALVPISEDSMDQRAGRAGRVRPGRCIRLWSRRFRPDEETAPEIERVELDDVVLRAALCGLDGRRFDEATWLSDPPEFAVRQSRRRLRKMGALDEDNRLTDRGRRMGQLPVGGDEARVLLDPPDDLAPTLADLVALLQVGRDFLLPRRLVDRSFADIKHERSELLSGCGDEVYVQLRCLRSGDADRHGLHAGALREARRIASSLRRRLDVRPRQPTDDDTDLAPRPELTEYLLDRIPESAFIVRSRALKYRRDGKARPGKPEPWGNGETELSVWPFEPPVEGPGADVDDHPVAGLVLDHFWLGDRGTGVRGTGRMVLPCTYGQLLDAGIYEQDVGEVRAGTKHGRPWVRGVVERTLAGITLDRSEQPLQGSALWRGAADAILEGRILRPAGDLVSDDLHLWDLMARWPTRDRDRTWDDVAPPPEPADYLTARLEELGVESDEDLMLVEPTDLRPDLPERLGIYRYQIEPFAEDFPRIWQHQGRKYHCRVKPVSRRVILEPADKKTRRAGEPRAQIVPRFRGFDVIYRNDSRVVPIRER